LGFFEQQERARRATTRLVVLFTLAVAVIVACANLIVVPVWVYWMDTRATPATYAVVSLITLAAISAGSLEIIARLSLGENELALLLAGKRVPRASAASMPSPPAARP
jgi:hypothetical protein